MALQFIGLLGHVLRPPRIRRHSRINSRTVTRRNTHTRTIHIIRIWRTATHTCTPRIRIIITRRAAIGYSNSRSSRRSTFTTFTRLDGVAHSCSLSVLGMSSSCDI
jgi:hypothetical protein